MPTKVVAVRRYGKLGDGPDGRGNCFGYDASHPEYVEAGYSCDKCGKVLRTADNGGQFV